MSFDGVVRIKLQEALNDLFCQPRLRDVISREHVEKTPERFVRALSEIYSGVFLDPRTALCSLFPADGVDEIIHVKEITFFSSCAHHMLPFFGTAHFAYIPNENIVGLSKIPRLIEVFARRPQVQEKLTTEIVTSFQEIVKPKGCAVMMRAYHMCCMARGIKQPTSYTETTKMLGIFKDGTTKAEFLASCNAYAWSWK